MSAQKNVIERLKQEREQKLEEAFIAFSRTPTDENIKNIRAKFQALQAIIGTVSPDNYFEVLLRYLRPIIENNKNEFTVQQLKNLMSLKNDFPLISRARFIVLIENALIEKNKIEEQELIPALNEPEEIIELPKDKTDFEKMIEGFNEFTINLEKLVFAEVDNNKFISNENFHTIKKAVDQLQANETSNLINLSKASEFITNVNAALVNLKSEFPAKVEAINDFQMKVDSFRKSLPIPNDMVWASSRLKCKIESVKTQSEKIDGTKSGVDRSIVANVAKELEKKRKDFFDGKEFYDTAKLEKFKSESLSLIEAKKNNFDNLKGIVDVGIEAVKNLVLSITPWDLRKTVSNFVDKITDSVSWLNTTTQNAQKIEKDIQNISPLKSLSKK